MTSNADVLRDAGLIEDREPLAPEYQDLIDALSSDEVNALVSIKSKLDEIGIPWVPLTAQAPRAFMPF